MRTKKLSSSSRAILCNCFLAVVLIASTVVADENNSIHDECFVYMAPSTQAGAGSGVFVTKDVAKESVFVRKTRIQQ
jgi:hypothetical protein